jgi:hypothetical protein
LVNGKIRVSAIGAGLSSVPEHKLMWNGLWNLKIHRNSPKTWFSIAACGKLWKTCGKPCGKTVEKKNKY